ncbi:MAG: metal-dependent hydrolase [Alphaproteobacteria bacterium]|uniref:Metal-dependent hydrolase n=1 Tax=Candidatus Nitrobium versatile TaxID=2884831 RepID=A0A953M157_9BACT|nr:metal-dependent hydrolase [Candidatus Nitrobium versatile]
MDPVTHALSGMVFRQLGFRGKAALFVLVFSAVAPDFDYITRLWGAAAFLKYHRGITHGVVALGVFPLAMGFLFRKSGGFFYNASLSFLGYSSHLLLDLTNQYGTRILAPLDGNRYSLDLTFIIDPYITLGLLLAVLLGKVSRRRPALIAACALLSITFYLGGKYYMQGEARQFLKTKMDAHTYKVYPLPNGFFRWWFVVRSGDEVTTGFVDLFLKKACVHEKYRVHPVDPAAIESKKSRVVQRFLAFAGTPHAEVKRGAGKTVVTWRELSYSFLPGERFVAEVVMDAKGEIIRAEFRM